MLKSHGIFYWCMCFYFCGWWELKNPHQPLEKFSHQNQFSPSRWEYRYPTTKIFQTSKSLHSKSTSSWVLGQSTIIVVLIKLTIGVPILGFRFNSFLTLYVQTKFLVFGLQGLVTLTLAVAKIHHQYGKSLFFISLYLVAIGQGGYMSCLLPFGADQFNEDSPQERQAKNSFFNWCIFTLYFSATSTMLIIVYIQENVGWAIGFGILVIAMAFVIFLFLLV